jgi:uncharacterized protein (DUF2235 family)
VDENDAGNATSGGRHLVLCCDGTWNDPRSRTNVRLIFEFLAERCGRAPVEEGETAVLGPCPAPGGGEILAFYQTGLGTLPGERIRGGLFGYGLSRKVAEAYAFLCRHWRAGDVIHLVGFSRGAFIARSLSGVVGRLGLLPAETPRDRLYDAVRASQEGRAVPRGERLPTIRFLGVFDTVGALGIPLPQFNWLNRFFGLTRFHDTVLSPVVEQACQALAIDERRGNFRPVVWSRRPGFVRLPDGSETAIRQRVLQVWFAGSHGDVGGGYPERDLSDVALRWMLRRMEKAGLPLGADWETARPGWGEPLGLRHDSTRGIFRLAEGGVGAVLRAVFPAGSFLFRLAPLFDLLQVGPYDRPLVGEIQADDPHLFSVPVGLQVHESVVERFATGGMPDKVRRALEANIRVFREPERPASPGARLDGSNVILLDRSPNGAAVKIERGAPPAPGTSVTLELPDEPSPRRARVAWRREDRVGLAFERAA